MEDKAMRDKTMRLALLAVFAVIGVGAVSGGARAEQTSAVDPALCRSLVKHWPAPDVAYQPGVDVYGKPVAPADLPGGAQIRLPSQIHIPLTINLAKAINLDTSAYPYNQLGAGTEAALGTLTVEGDKVFFNGEPLSDEQEDNLSVLCLQPSGEDE